MGRAAILLVIGLGIAFGIISNSIRSSLESLTLSQVSYNKYSIARNLARTAIHATLRAYDRGLNPIPSSGIFNGGSYTVNLITNVDTLWMTTVGTYEDSSYRMNVQLLRSTKPFPTTNAAIGIRAAPVNFKISGGASVDGHNWDSTGTSLIGSGDLPGVTTMNKIDSITVATNGGTNINGVPPVKVDTSTVDPLAFLTEYQNNADYVYNTPGTYSGATWGSAGAPAIVYCNAGADTSFAIKFTGSVVGYGILVVQGNVQFNGNFSFYGLVVVSGFNTQVQFGAAGTPQIVGGLIVAGNAGASVTLKGTGNAAKVKYSSEALSNARNIGKLRYYKIISWYE
ncbi:MAG TPA: hypothetical protein VI758_11405 [Bacteroidota bacterium]